MLSLSRKTGQDIVIYDKISNTKIIVNLGQTDKGKAVINIDAPKSVIIDRREIYERKLVDSFYEVAKWAQ